MSPIRRYLRITKYSVLEVRIYLDKPSDAPWLLSSRDPVLPRIIEEVRPKVLPKLREENESSKRKGSKKNRGIKDVVSQDDFEVTIFLTELSTRHSLLTKQKSFRDKPRLKSTSNKLTGWLNTSENPIHIEDDERPPEILQEHAGDVPELRDIPESDASNKRKDATVDEDEPLFVSSDDEEFFATQRAARSSKRRKRNESGQDETRAAEADNDEAEGEETAAGNDDKKKLAMNTSYDGFSIYGRILCLVVKRKGKRSQPLQTAPAGGSQMMEQWVSTQAAQDAGLDEDDEG
ncbi:hypothetical protein KC367_g4429 [Hortaea werneckii]|uniref:Uncharacterized protein n=2 Tax=Hortaea werneckii TaxID=91943 RepID=A0A3M7I282_HORWE|nr:hypothetical protein KC358_g17853 [Hortaea werneckii]OTA38906.1 hypothetical protein BTJ68_01406 [Hortaea werneckii EXF-2000]KAI6791693.1 hypothetical protein KC350_g17781 [Hortaea werneckii]KAI6826682.1 hypothetical protein KC342_g10371 [Hortaea werneckii]KAI6897331.1 hypothetical protein KC348_g17754 [Hortaea werneckii]